MTSYFVLSHAMVFQYPRVNLHKLKSNQNSMRMSKSLDFLAETPFHQNDRHSQTKRIYESTLCKSHTIRCSLANTVDQNQE
jgi:hypothetical protein